MKKYFLSAIGVLSALFTVACTVACSDENSSVIPEAPLSNAGAALPQSSAELATSSAEEIPPSSSAESAAISSAVIATSSSDISPTSSADAAFTWNKANLTWYESYPDEGSEECIEYNGCEWAGWFAGLDDQQTPEWVAANNIIAVHEKDWAKYKLKTFRLRKNGHEIDAVVYDMCSDADCDGCCTENAGEIGFLIDIEVNTKARFGGIGDGVVEWTCLNCEF